MSKSKRIMLKKHNITGKCCGHRFRIYNNGYWNSSELYQLYVYGYLCPACGNKIKLKMRNEKK